MRGLGYRVSKSRRLLQIICAITWCLFAAGPLFGFAAIKPIFIEQGVYQDKCNDTNSNECSQQELALDFLFTAGCMITNISALPVGWILDSYGPKITGIIGSIILSIGAFSLSWASRISIVDGYLVGFIFLALAGPFVFISCFQLANSFPKHSGLILALITGSFDASSGLFLFYRIYYDNVYKLSIGWFFTIYLLVPIFIFTSQMTLMPDESYKTVGTLAKIAETGIDESGKPLDKDLLYPQDVIDQEADDYDNTVEFYQPTIQETATSLLTRRASIGVVGSDRTSLRRASFSSVNSNKSIYEQEADIKLTKSSGGVFGILHGYSIRDQMSSNWFLLMCLFTMSQMLRINYFVATIKSQELYLYGGNEEIATKINHFFDVALPLAGILAVPFIGLILDNFTTLSVFTLLTALTLFIGITGLLSWLPATYAGILVLVVFRPFFYTSVTDFCAKVFGYETFGTVYGSIIAFSGLCNIFQQVMDKITHLVFNKNPGPINIMLTILTGVSGIALVGFVRSQEMDLKRLQLEMEAQEAINRPIPT
ncbi:Protein FMP42 [Spathaspora sp. JA1]|nr:Protein FMP42 [Spathaspora sp. JA1]